MPLSLTFGSVLIGSASAAQQLTLTNSGDLPLSPVTVAASGDFSATNGCGASLEGHSTCAITVTFVPKISGAETGTITVTDPIRTQSVALSGTGVAPPTGTLLPSALIFGVQGIGTTSAPEAITVTNSGDLTLTGIVLGISGDFAQTTTCAATLAAHSTCSISVTFTPRTNGTETGTLTFIDVIRTQTVPLLGNALGPAALSSTPASLNFGNVLMGATSAGQTVTLVSTGEMPLTGLAWSVPAGFSIAANTCGATLALSAVCKITLVFTPVQAGAAAGTLTVSAANLASPVGTALSGFGQDFSLQASGSPATVASGQTASYTVQIGSLGATFGTVSLACTGAPKTPPALSIPDRSPLPQRELAS